ncbi:MAG TPA: type II toxin-antitoxin system VapC family toxin [Candidatus Sulfotelmatobacter sp.]|jgi:predicted nucleic acid-binding protein|nr:type II toxin-antitoxin system VapC family toxin [Candidatus Sulfotelmatobacter sp.]
MSRIFWDTNLFIYLFEGSAVFGGQVASLREKMLRRGDQLVTSTLTLGEVLVKPMKEGDAKLFQEYADVLPAVAVLLPFDEKAATVYAKLRGDSGLRAPDAIQLACAASFGVDLFVTNDARLHNRQVPGIQFIVPLERVPI